jgi:hypothetical protein
MIIRKFKSCRTENTLWLRYRLMLLILRTFVMHSMGKYEKLGDRQVTVAAVLQRVKLFRVCWKFTYLANIYT